MTKYYVVAGNRNEFQEFIHRKSGELWQAGKDVSFSHFVYVDSEEKLAGVQNPHGWFYGTWRQRKDIRILLEVLHSRSNFNSALTEISFSLK